MLGEKEQRLAHELAALLVRTGVAARTAGEGVHWRVAADQERRGLEVHCFWYERADSGLLLGMNSANQRSRLRGRTPPPYEGPEFLTLVFEGGPRRGVRGTLMTSLPVPAPG